MLLTITVRRSAHDVEQHPVHDADAEIVLLLHYDPHHTKHLTVPLLALMKVTTTKLHVDPAWLLNALNKP